MKLGTVDWEMTATGPGLLDGPGWASDWPPPPEHARDWTGRALELTERLGL